MGSADDVAADDGGDAEAPRPSASDLRRVGAALRLDGIDRPRQEIEPVLDAFLRSWIASRPDGDSSASAMFARRRVEHAAGARGRDLEAWRELPDVVRCEAEFDDARAKVLAAAFGMPLDAAARTALRLGKMANQAKLRIVRASAEWSFVLKDDLSVAGVKIPAVLGREDDEQLDERVLLLDQLDAMVKGLLGQFLALRTSPEWQSDELPALLAWVAREDIA